MTSTASDTSSVVAQDTHHATRAPGRCIHYAIPYVEIRNTSAILPREVMRRTQGKRVIVPCYAAMESDFLANCLQGLSGMPGCESALLGTAWYPTAARPHPTSVTGVKAVTASRSSPSSSSSTANDDAEHAPLSGDKASDTRAGVHSSALSGAAVTDLARTDFFRPPPHSSTSAVHTSSQQQQQPDGTTTYTAGVQTGYVASAPSTSFPSPSPALAPRPPQSPPTGGVGLRAFQNATNAPHDGNGSGAASEASTVTPAPLRGGIRSQWGTASAQTAASTLYNAYVWQSRLDGSGCSLTGEDACRRVRDGAEGFHVDVCAGVTPQAMDEAEEREARYGQTNILTAMFMPVATPSEVKRGASAPAPAATALLDGAVRCTTEVARLKSDEEDESSNPQHFSGGDSASSKEGAEEEEEEEEEVVAPGLSRHTHTVTGGRSGQALDEGRFTCFASNALGRMPSYEFPQLSDAVLEDVASFMVRRSTAARHVCTTSTNLSLCQGLGDPTNYRADVCSPETREAAYSKGLELLMTASFLML